MTTETSQKRCLIWHIWERVVCFGITGWQLVRVSLDAEHVATLGNSYVASMIPEALSIGSHVLSLALSMPRTPKGHKRPADVISNAVHVMKIATGEINETGVIDDDGKNAAAVALGRKGGRARAAALNKAKRSAIAKRAAKARWR